MIVYFVSFLWQALKNIIFCTWPCPTSSGHGGNTAYHAEKVWLAGRVFSRHSVQSLRSLQLTTNYKSVCNNLRHLDVFYRGVWRVALPQEPKVGESVPSVHVIYGMKSKVGSARLCSHWVGQVNKFTEHVHRMFGLPSMIDPSLL